MMVMVPGTVWWGSATGEAVIGPPAGRNPGVVRIYELGTHLGSGILVDRNWVLTTGHIFIADLSQYSFRFGGTDDTQDARSQDNLRTFDRMAVHPTVPELVMLHFADPVPEDTKVLPVATTNPFASSAHVGVLWGWGAPRSSTGGVQLRFRSTSVIDDDPASNIARLKARTDTAADLGTSIPLALAGHVSRGGDSGGGLLRGGIATAMHWGHGTYRRPNETGTLSGPKFDVSYEIPLWPYAQWIRSVINGEGSSTPNPPPHDELKRRKLIEGDNTSGQAVMTGPVACPGDGTCNPAPVTPSATLVAFSTHQGSVMAGCAGSDTGDSCSFDSISHPKNSRPVLQLAPPPKTGIDAKTGRRKITVWCKHTGSLTVGAPPGDLVRFSFTNTDDAEATPAYGWWDVSPKQVESSPDTFLSGSDLKKLNTCPS